jgi:aspartyl-tRNA(Asn)/glutamyl-tRNA(Gln) amidotransferase subunit A
MELTNLTIAQIHQGLIKKDFSASELCKTFLDKIKEKNKEIFAFLTVSEDLALSKAKEIDDMILAGYEIPLLAGVPSAIKDNILVENVSCTAGSRILEDYIAPYDASVVKKLKNQGVVILGKTNLDEFAMGSSTENSAFGPTRNPFDLTRVPGGSSGGSAAAVAARLSVFALGSDTGGSIRQPSSFCGVVGLKPTYGAVSRYGLIAFASSLDQIGPIAKTVEDCQIVFNAIKGKDEMDSTSVEALKIKNYRAKRRASSSPSLLLAEARKLKIKNLRIGVPKEYFVKGINPEVERLIKLAIKKYEEMGAYIKEISLPYTEYALPCYAVISCPEASANLARYDAIKYGEIKNKKLKIKNLFDYYLIARGEGFGAEVRRRIMLGTYALSVGYYEAYYLRAQKIRTLIKNDFEKAFKEVDLIFAPVSPFLPFKIGERINDPLSMYLSDIYTVSVNLVGFPALSLPIGKAAPLQNGGEGLPVGLQIIGKPFEEDKILEIGKLYASN